MSDMYPGWSPYNYVLNNPLRYIDPTGMYAEALYGEGGRVAQRQRDAMAMGKKEEEEEKDDKERIEEDGRLSFTEAYSWWKTGAGIPLNMDLSKLDLSSITKKDFPDGVNGSIVYFNLLFRGNARDGLVYGTLGLILQEDGSVKANYDRYDFDFKQWNSLRNITRNVENGIGAFIHGYGVPFRINFYGSGKLGEHIPPKPLKYYK